MARYITRRSFFQQRWGLGRRQYNLNGRRVKGPLKGTGTTNILAPGTSGGGTVQGQLSTYGLNAANQELAELGVPIPVLFGNRKNENGGFISTPLLVYQRMYSKGAYEEVRIGFVCGEGGTNLKLPTKRGIRIGTDLLHSKQPEFYQIRFTSGQNNDQDPKFANTDPWGDKTLNPLAPGNKFFSIRDPNDEIRGLSQSFDPGVSFGLESEQPDCTQTYDQEFSSLIPIPDPSSSPLIKYSPVDASVGNTRGCRTTEFGFAVNMPQPAPVAQEQSGDGVPVGSKWQYKRLSITTNAIRLCWDGGQYEPTTRLPIISGVFETHNDGFKAEILSPDSAFYALYRPFYKTESQEDIALIYNKFMATYGSTKILYFDPRKLPSPIWAMDPSEFNLVQPSGNSYFERIDGQFSDSNYNNLDPCELGFLDSETLLDARVPKIFFNLYYRKLDDSSANWKSLSKKQFCFLSPDAATLYASLKVHHPRLREQAYEYRFKPVTPVQLETETQAVYEKCKYGVATSGGGTSQQETYVLYPGSGQEQQVNAEDGFRLTFEGLIEPVQSEVKLDVQSENFDVKISYVNEFVDDPDVRYPYMSVGMLELRAGKGISSLDQLSFFYSQGAKIERVDGTNNASFLFPDLCYYLLTQYPGGGPGPVERDQVDVASFEKANTFTESKNLRYNGVITDRVGIHEFISEHAKFFLLRFGTKNGRYALFSAINDSVTDTPTASPTQVVTLDIIDDSSFSIDYATLAEREDAKMHVIYRDQDRNMPGINKSVTVQPVGYNGANKVTHDISGFCTSKEHALTVARFLSSMRNKQDRVVQFTCADSAVDLSPGRLFTFDITIETSRGNTYTNTDQYQVTNRTYRDNGTLDVRAVYMPAGIHDMIFTNQEFEEVD